jgi:hypothetical protein
MILYSGRAELNLNIKMKSHLFMKIHLLNRFRDLKGLFRAIWRIELSKVGIRKLIIKLNIPLLRKNMIYLLEMNYLNGLSK